MELSKFCPRCGNETERLYGNKKKLCPECFPDKNDLLDLPETVEMTICSVCGRLRKHGEWIEEHSLQGQLGAKFEEFSEENVRMELQYWEENERMFVRVHAVKDDMKDEYDTELKIHEDQCSNCARFNSGFFKVKMQLRGDADLEEISKEMADEAAEATNEDRKDFLSNIEDNREGFDFFFSTEKIAGKVLEVLKARYSPEVKRSYELVGEEDGEKVYRNVISVRINEV